MLDPCNRGSTKSNWQLKTGMMRFLSNCATPECDVSKAGCVCARVSVTDTHYVSVCDMCVRVCENKNYNQTAITVLPPLLPPRHHHPSWARVLWIPVRSMVSAPSLPLSPGASFLLKASKRPLETPFPCPASGRDCNKSLDFSNPKVRSISPSDSSGRPAVDGLVERSQT